MSKGFCQGCRYERSTNKTKNSFESIIKFALKHNCEVLSKKEDYKNNRSKINFKCKCGNNFSKTYFSFVNTPKCNKCSEFNNIGSKIYSYEYAEEFIKTHGNCLLLTKKDDYMKNSTKIKLLCQCGEIFETTFYRFKNKNKRMCKKCKENDVIDHSVKWTYEKTKDFIENNSDCKLLTSQDDYKNSYSKIKLKCNCGNEFITKFTYFLHDNKKQCNQCGLAKTSGENCSLWKGGISSERDIVKKSEEYKTWREKVFEKDSYSCQCCGDNKGGNLHAHHIKNFAEYKELRFDINNGITLCENCHNPSVYGSFHYIYSAKNNTKEQLDEYIFKYKNGEFNSLKINN